MLAKIFNKIESLSSGFAVISFTLMLFFGPFVQNALAEFYMCRNANCAMYVITDSEGYSWHIECMDGTTADGRTDGATYGGRCPQVTI